MSNEQSTDRMVVWIVGNDMTRYEKMSVRPKEIREEDVSNNSCDKRKKVLA